MSNNKNSDDSDLLRSEVSKDTHKNCKKRENTTAPASIILLLLRLLKKTQIIATLLLKILSKLSKKVLKITMGIKSGMTIAAVVVAAILAGHTMSTQLVVAQTSSLASLKTVSIPEPDNIDDFIRDKTAAIALGKVLFWDMQVGSDGIQACASCHFHGGADNRSKNQINPGLLQVNADRSPNADTTFNTGGGANYQLKPEDYPFHKLADPSDRLSSVLSDSNDVTSSQGVFKANFIDIVPGDAEDKVEQQEDPVFNVHDIEVRRVQSRNTPTVINAVFNFRNFWDGRAQNIFNGVNPLGPRDSQAFVLQANGPNQLKQVQVRLNNSSLASQAVEPPTSEFEQSAAGRVPLPSLTNNAALNNQEPIESSGVNAQLEASDQFSPNELSLLGNKKIGKKLLSLKPLGKQLVHPEDSFLGVYSNWPEPGLKVSYASLIQAAFQPNWWKSNLVIRTDENGNGSVIKRPNRALTTSESALIEYNCSLFFGLAVQAYESTLVSDDTPFDQYLEGKTHALTEQQKLGFDIFQNKGQCIGCHVGTEFTVASISNVVNQGRTGRTPSFTGSVPEDTGFFNIGVRPVLEDLGVGGDDLLGNSLSETRLTQQGKFQQIFGENPVTLNPPLNSDEAIVADGAFKAPGLRNVELTAPYMHNGGMLTLEEVVDFYNRGGDFKGFPGLPVLKLTPEEKAALVVFMKGLTDERVRYQKAPFDHPQLFVPNGHPGNQNNVHDDSTGKATDDLLEIPAVGRNGGDSLPNFLATSSQ